MTSCEPTHLPKVSPPNTITLGIRTSTYEFWGKHKHLVHNKRQDLIREKKDLRPGKVGDISQDSMRALRLWTWDEQGRPRPHMVHQCSTKGQADTLCGNFKTSLQTH